MAFTGSCAILLRFSNLKTVVRSGSNVSAITNNLTHRLANSRLYATEQNDQAIKDSEALEKPMSKAMKAYLQRAKQHDEFMATQNQEYQIGKRHLANIMGEDPDQFTQRDIDAAIRYLFPSGLYDLKARPIFKPPEEIFPRRKAAEFDSSGRPFHSMFYTCKPNYYQTLHELVEKFNSLNEFEDRMIKKGLSPDSENSIETTGSLWMSKAEIEKLILEALNDQEYGYLIISLERLAAHPYSYTIKPEIMKYRKTLVSQTEGLVIPSFQHDSNGRPFIRVKHCSRKSARGKVTIFGNGSGQITINGQNLCYFDDIQSREQVYKQIVNYEFYGRLIASSGNRSEVIIVSSASRNKINYVQLELTNRGLLKKKNKNPIEVKSSLFGTTIPRRR